MLVDTMNFKEATDTITNSLGHSDLADALGVSVASIRQARLKPSAKAYRAPPKNWPLVIIRLAEQQIMRTRELIEATRKELGRD
jgi:hypothetical protein